MKKVKMNTKGFTLMEVLISIAMVGLLFAPMLNFFSHSAKMNINAKNMQRANTVAQTVMEEVRSYDTIEDMVATYEDATNKDYLVRTTSLTSNERYSAPVVATGGGFTNNKYYFIHKKLVNDGKEYTARIKVDCTVYDNLNNTGLPVISSLGSGSTVMAAEKDETLKTLYEYQSRYHAATNGGDISLETLAENLEKKIKVKITDVATSDNMVQVSVYNEYKMNGSYDGCGESIQSEYLYNEEVVYEKLKGIYLFYNYDVYGAYGTDKNILQGIDIDVNYSKPEHSNWRCDYTLYAFCQKVYSVDSNTSLVEEEMDNYAKSQPTVETIINIEKNSNPALNDPEIISNFKYNYAGSSKDGDTSNLVKTENVQRLSEVTVQIFDNKNEMCCEVKSTRGE